jgi:hypothetical protein
LIESISNGLVGDYYDSSRKSSNESGIKVG